MVNTSGSDAQRRRHELMEAGREATELAAVIYQPINDQIELIMMQLINHYRQGVMNHDYIIGKLGEVAGLTQLLSDLEMKQNRASLAAEKELSNAPQK